MLNGSARLYAEAVAVAMIVRGMKRKNDAVLRKMRTVWSRKMRKTENQDLVIYDIATCN